MELLEELWRVRGVTQDDQHRAQTLLQAAWPVACDQAWRPAYSQRKSKGRGASSSSLTSEQRHNGERALAALAVAWQLGGIHAPLDPKTWAHVTQHLERLSPLRTAAASQEQVDLLGMYLKREALGREAKDARVPAAQTRPVRTRAM
jgi:hypothetical protein